jgi:hypothetical protein
MAKTLASLDPNSASTAYWFYTLVKSPVKWEQFHSYFTVVGRNKRISTSKAVEQSLECSKNSVSINFTQISYNLQELDNILSNIESSLNSLTHPHDSLLFQKSNTLDTQFTEITLDTAAE